METTELILKFDEKNELYSFKEKVNLLTNEKLIKILGRENIKNSNSSLIIKSMHNLPIFDVIQFKINVEETGTFLFNFEKDKIDEEIRNELLEKIKSLKDGIKPTKEAQIKKIYNLFRIVNDYNPIYCSYVPFGETKLNLEELQEISNRINISFPTLMLQKTEKIKTEKNTKEIHIGKITIPSLDMSFQKISPEFIFISIFALLFSFATFIGLYEILNKQSVAAFLLVLAFVFLCVLGYSIYSLIYPKNKENHSGIKLFVLIYIAIGISLGIIIGFVISKYVIKLEVENINYVLIFSISIPATLILSILTIFISKLINKLIIKKIK